MHVVSVVGARPQFVKLAPVGNALRDAGHRHTIVHTGQHYDPGLSDAFFDDLGIEPPDLNLGVGSGSHGEQTGRMLIGLDETLATSGADWVLTYGDTNSTLAAALTAAKLHLRCAHLEAGLRSHNRRMPEEINRVLTDHACDLLLAPTPSAVTNLQREGLSERSVLVGDVMIDVLEEVRQRVLAHPPQPTDGYIEGPFVFATIHRAENTDDPDRLRTIVAALARLAQPTVLAVHPRLRDRAASAGILLEVGSMKPQAPLSYPATVRAMLDARAVVTDSGGLQKEAFHLGTPCTTVRPETEWPETFEGGMNVLVEPGGIDDATVFRDVQPPHGSSPFGGGHAAERVVTALEDGIPG